MENACAYVLIIYSGGSSALEYDIVMELYRPLCNKQQAGKHQGCF